MKFLTSARPPSLGSARALALIAAALLAGCIDDQPGLASNTGGSATAGQGSDNRAGDVSNGASSGSQGEEPKAGTGAVAGQGDGVGGASIGGSAMAPNGGEPNGGEKPEASAGALGMAGDTNDEGVHIAEACTFHVNPQPATGGTGGTGDPGGGGTAGGGTAGMGGAAAATNISVQVSAFVGNYLADGTGRALYTNGGDLPGDCHTPPQSLCTADCLVSWPAFDAGARVLSAGLTDAGFGTIPRADGVYQTTYMGWPLYYYKSDLTLGQLTGQGKGKTWHVAKVNAPNVTLMKAGTLKYLADAAGHTLYVSAADQAGTGDADPVSNCDKACLKTFEGFRVKNLVVVTSLDTLDFSVFVRNGAGGLQTAYKGIPLYRAATDLKSGDMNGIAVAGFTAAAP